MSGFQLDTNHLGAALNEDSDVRKRIVQAHRTGSRFGTCVPVLCELEVGILQVARPEEYRRALTTLLQRVKIWPIGQDVAREYGRIYLNLRRQGRVLSQVDMMLAALAISMDLTLLTSDRDFEVFTEFRMENWSN